MKDLEFKLRHDLNKLYRVSYCYNSGSFLFGNLKTDVKRALFLYIPLLQASSERRNFTLRDIIMLKIILVSGLYPQLAFPDDCNSYSSDSDQVRSSRRCDGIGHFSLSVVLMIYELVPPLSVLISIRSQFN